MPSAEVLASIKARLAAYETERVAARRQLSWRLPLFLGPTIAACAAVAWGLYLFIPAAVVFFLAFAGWGPLRLAWRRSRRPATYLQQSLRNSLLPIVFGFVEDVRYYNEMIPAGDIRPPEEALGAYGNHIEADDCISGRYRGFEFVLYEARLGAGEDEVFRGLIVAFELAQPFAGLLVAVRKADVVTALAREVFGGPLTTFASGDPSLDIEYEFCTNNEEAARPLVSGSLAAMLGWLRKTLPDPIPHIALSDKRGFLLVPTTGSFLGAPTHRNYFELPPISVPIEYGKHIEPMIADLVVLLEAAALTRQAAAAGKSG